ncbi:MAG: heavy-metal-associated domain-containing protein [Wenzhouxiangella sp.]
MPDKIAIFLSLVFVLGLNLAQADNASSEVKLAIPNMVCMSCEMRVEEAVFQVSGVSAIEFDGEAKTALIRFDESLATIDQIMAACEEAGYPATVLAPGTI